MKMQDMGYKSKNDMPMAVSSKEGNKIRYPSFSIYEKVPDFLMKKDVGDTCELVMQVKVTEKSIESSTSSDKRERIGFEIMKMAVKEGDDDALKSKISSRKN